MKKGCVFSKMRYGATVFFEFIPTDVDSDGIFEIVGTQYVSLGGHSSGIGNGKVVLRYNVEQEDFFVIDSEFLFQNETVKNTWDASAF